MNYRKASIYVLTVQSVILGVGIYNAAAHPSWLTIGALAFMAALLPLTLRNVFATIQVIDQMKGAA